MVTILQDLDHLVTRPLQLNAGFAIPNALAIARMKGDMIVQTSLGSKLEKEKWLRLIITSHHELPRPLDPLQ
jgi:hypothetical protein